MRRIVLNRDIFGCKAAIIENDRVMEIFVERDGESACNGHIYKGKVSNVIPGMEAAFVNIGMEKNAFLHIDNVAEYQQERNREIGAVNKSIDKYLNVGEEVLVQAVSEPTGGKGARITTQCTIPGKFLVLVPGTNQISISKKIGNSQERERLEEIISNLKPENFGVIIRTAAADKPNFHLEREMEYLLKRWEKLLSRVRTGNVGDILYSENDLISRMVRDVFSEDIDEFIVNDEELYQDILNYVNAFGDQGSGRKIKLYDDYEDIFDRYKITEEIGKALEKIVYLECGGYLVIESTEALTTIDVNTGKNIGRDALKIGLENTTLKTNLEAAREIPRQLMLRNIGGIIIIDFIDMKEEENRTLLLNELATSLKVDRIKNSIIHFTDLNLIEMTRKRTGNPLGYYYYDNCPMCNGKGKIKSQEALVEDILREIRVIMKDTDFSGIKISAEKELYKKIKEEYLDFIESYAEKRKKKLFLEEIGDRNISKWYEITLIK